MLGVEQTCVGIHTSILVATENQAQVLENDCVRSARQVVQSRWFPWLNILILRAEKSSGKIGDRRLRSTSPVL